MAGLGENVGKGFIAGLVRQNPLTVARHIFGGIPNALGALVTKGMVSIGSLPAKALSALGKVGGFLRGALTKVGGLFGKLFGGAGGGVSKWGGLMMAVLKHFGIPQLFGTFMTQMQTESGGDPRAINLWDSNAKAGIPSQGLMQVIPPTFAAYAGPYRSRGILDPLANIYAAVAYAISRYGASIGAVLGHGHGYAAGGPITEPVTGFGHRSGALYSFGERGPEWVSPLTGPAPALGARQGVVVNVYPQRGQSEVEIAAAVSRRLAWAAATGRA
jgi:SLT domain-containing protein